MFEILKDGHLLIDVKGTINDDIEVKGIALDSRKINEDFIFVAFKGATSDGHDFIESAISKGAKMIVCESLPSNVMADVSYYLVNNARKAAALLAHEYNGNPSKKMKVLGVTGTNGKTTIATLLYQTFISLGYKCGLISTVENRIGDEVLSTEYTTPDACTLAELFSTMQTQECSHVFMEVSSHAAEQERITGIDFNGAIFTNITHDHLDYHKTFLAYIRAKKSFFDQLDDSSFALINIDDKNGEVMVQNTRAKVRTYALRRMADFKCKLISNDLYGLHLRINEEEAVFRMAGEFNAYNITAVIGASVLLGEDLHQIITKVSSLKGAEGRMEKIMVEGKNTIGIVDYAHTPDALENVLKTLKTSMNKGQNLITVVGCGGNRDAAKRPIMAEIAARYSDKVILTSDNPRNENPEDILDQMEMGIKDDQKSRVLRITDRAAAIKTASMLAGNEDAILVAGKGHEKYQDIKGVKTPFEDKKVLEEALAGHA